MDAIGPVVTVGVVVTALAAIFTFLHRLPWEPRGSVAELRTEVQTHRAELQVQLRRELDHIRDAVNEQREDVREIRRLVEAASRRGGA